MKLGVFCVLAVSVTGLMAMLIQGCKRQPAENADNNPVPDTNGIAAMDTNQPSMDLSNQPPMMSASSNLAPVVQTPVIPQIPPAAPEGTEYVVVKGDTLAKIAKAHGVTVKALQNANPNVQPTKLKVGDKLIVPAGSAPAAGAAAPAATGSSGSDTTTYVVKSGDTLSKIAKAHGTTIKAIESANGLSTTKIKVGQKLKIPAKAEAAAPAPVEAPVAPAPAATPAPAPAPVH